MRNRHTNVSKDHRWHRRFLGWYIEVCFSKWCLFWTSKVSSSKKYSVNTLIYVDFELEVKKVDGNFVEIKDFDFRDIEEI